MGGVTVPTQVSEVSPEWLSAVLAKNNKKKWEKVHVLNIQPEAEEEKAQVGLLSSVIR